MDGAGLYIIYVGVLIFNFAPSGCILIVIPEDVATGLAAIYGFTPRILKANDQRVGFGFRFGNHADFQVQYEFGPQVYTRPLQPISRVRPSSAARTSRQRVVRRKPFVELLLRAGILKESSYDIDEQDDAFDEPR